MRSDYLFELERRYGSPLVTDKMRQEYVNDKCGTYLATYKLKNGSVYSIHSLWFICKMYGRRIPIVYQRGEFINSDDYLIEKIKSLKREFGPENVKDKSKVLYNSREFIKLSQEASLFQGPLYEKFLNHDINKNDLLRDRYCHGDIQLKCSVNNLKDGAFETITPLTEKEIQFIYLTVKFLYNKEITIKNKKLYFTVPSFHFFNFIRYNSKVPDYQRRLLAIKYFLKSLRLKTFLDFTKFIGQYAY